MRTQLLTQSLVTIVASFTMLLSYGQLQVTNTTPTMNERMVSRDANIVVEFDAAVDAATVNTSNIIIRGDQTGIISWTFSGGGTNTITFNPISDFLGEERITVTLTTGLTNTSAQPLVADYAFNFTAATLASNYLQIGTVHNGFAVTPGGDINITGDFDNDGDIDIVDAGSQLPNIFISFNDGNQNFSRTTATTAPVLVWDMHEGDMDSDGDLDIIFSEQSAGYIQWLNNDGTGTFTLDSVGAISSVSNLEVADLDSDGDLDVVADQGDSLIWYENDGTQNFVIHTITTTSSTASDGFITDLDMDGDLDLVWCINGVLNWYENDGSQNFTEHLIDANDVNDLEVADIDRNGNLDIVTSEMSWYTNDGSQTFTKNLIPSTSYISSIKIADLDGDYLLDILADGSGDIFWFRADRTQSFDERLMLDGSSGDASVNFADIDGDGDTDLSINGRISGLPRISWIEMDTMLTTSPAQFEQNVLASAPIVLNFAEVVNAASINDAVISVRGEYTGKISGTFAGAGTSTITFTPDDDFLPGESIIVTISDAMIKSNGYPIYSPFEFEFKVETTPYGFTPSSYTKHLVTDSLNTCYSVVPVDLNGDGAMDVISASFSNDKVVWFENDGAENYTEHLVDATIEPYHVGAVDLDHDGDLDIYCGDGLSSIFWYENDGNENFTTHTLPTIPAMYHQSNGFTNVQAHDIDGDGDIDFSFTTSGNQDFGSFINDGNENFSFQIVDDNEDYGIFTTLNADYNGDGVVDFITSNNTNGMIFLDNDEELNFESFFRGNITGGTGDITANDVDGDGDVDFFASSTSDVFWYENMGDTTFTEHQIFNMGFAINSELYSVDMDGDADVDVLVSYGIQDSIYWLENDGSQNFTPHFIYTGNRVMYLRAADMDDDGDMDVLASSTSDNEVYWFEFSCTPADEPVVATPTPACSGPDVTLTWTGNLNDASEWEIRTGSCSGPVVATTSNNAIDVNPTQTTTYYIQGAGTCGSAGCDTVTVVVYPVYNINETVAVHSGDVVTFPDASTQTILSDSVTHTCNLTTVNGCDSIIQTTVLLTPDTPPNGTCDGVLDFDGVNDHVNVGGWYHAVNTFTVEFWANIPATSNAWDHIVENGSVQYGYNGAYRIQVGNEGEVYCAVGNGAGYNDGGYASGYNLGWEYGEWNHYALTYDGDTVRVFLNGVERISYTTGGMDITTGDGTLLFSSWQNVNRFYNGMLDEVRIWNTAKNSAQIVSTMSTQLTGVESGLLGYWDFNDGYGTTVSDISTFPNNGTMVAMDPVTDWVTVNGAQVNSSQTVTICDNDSLVVGNNTYYITGIYTDTMTTGQGCDSIVVTDLTVAPSYNIAVSATVCAGTDYTFPDGSVQTITAQTIQTSTLQSVNLCDSIIVTTVDIDVPTIVCPGNQGVNASPGVCTFTVGSVPPVSITNNCGATTLTWSMTGATTGSGSGNFGSAVLNVGVTTVTYYATDAYGNSGSCSFPVEIYDVQPPTAVCQNITAYLDASGNASITGMDLDGGSTDNCSGLVFSASTTDFTCADIGANNVTLTVTDQGANTASCTAVVTVADTVSPEITCPANETFNASSGVCTYWLGSMPPSGVADNCSSVDLTWSMVGATTGSGTGNFESLSLNTGVNTVTYNATDIYGNVGSCSFTVEIIDIQPPTITNPGDMTVCAGDTVTFATPTGSDNCSQTVTQTDVTGLSSGMVFPVGTTTLEFTSTDGSGNTAVSTFNVTVNPTYNETTSATICDGESYTFGAQTLTAAGTYTEVYSTVNGCDSTIVLTLNVNPVYNETATATICDGESYTFGAQTLTTAGTYTEVFQSGSGCDSTVMLTLVVNTVDASVTVSGHTITASNANATYQWIDCDNGTPVAGATSQDFTPTANGSYAVIVTENNCSDTSDCETISTIGLNEEVLVSVNVYPNPNNGKFWMELNGNTSEIIYVEVINMLGQVITTKEITTSGKHEFDLGMVERGVYNLRFSSNSGIALKQIVVH